jgi:Flp pilus assembly protein TadD
VAQARYRARRADPTSARAREPAGFDRFGVIVEVEGWAADAASQRSPGIEAAVERIKTTGVQGQIARLTEAKKTMTPAAFEDLFAGADLVTRALIAAERVTDAVALSRALTELYPASARARLVHGFALAVSGDARGAAQEYAKGKEIYRPPANDPSEKFPQDDERWYYLDQLARTAVEWGHVGEAVPLARTIAELYPATARSRTTYGLALFASGDVQSAAAEYEKALR